MFILHFFNEDEEGDTVEDPLTETIMWDHGTRSWEWVNGELENDPDFPEFLRAVAMHPEVPDWSVLEIHVQEWQPPDLREE
jgi:hypothetical protein